MSELAVLLNHLIEIDYDAIEAYEAAVARLADAADQFTLRHFVEDHRRHVSELAGAVRELGGVPAEHGDVRHIVRTGRVLVGGLIGDDAILRAMFENERHADDGYEEIVARDDLPRGLRSIVERALDDERHHRAWLDKRIGLTPKGEPVVTAFVREIG